jgi:hypothetical protein
MVWPAALNGRGYRQNGAAAAANRDYGAIVTVKLLKTSRDRRENYSLRN